MEKFKVSFVANNQQLTATGTKHASDTYADIEATFTLGERWTDMDSVSAVWWNDFTRIATVLDSEGKCTVPYEVLTRKGCVRVNLVGSVVEDGELVTRLTSYSAEAVHVNEKIKLTGNEPQTITPSQFEQFVENVKADADRAESAKESAQDASASAQGYAQSASASATSASESATASEQAATASARDAQTVSEIAVEVEVMKNEAELARDEILGMRATATTLEEGSQATANYSNGVLSLGIPRGDTGATGAKGDKGDTGATPNLTIGNVETLEPTESATATITGTAENPVLNLGIPQGDTGEVSLADLSTLLPTDTASGSIASFPDGQSVIPVVSLLADIEPIQDLNGYDKPWSGGNGKNKLPPKTGQAGSAQLILGDDATAIASASGVYLKSGTYTLSVDSTKTSTIYWYDVSSGANEGIGNTLAPRTVTVSEDGYYFPFLYNSSGISSSDVTTFQLELGSTATSYEPYSNICPISGHTECVTSVCGVNVWDEEWERGVLNWTTYLIKPSPSGGRFCSKNYIPVIPNTQYYMTPNTNVAVAGYETDTPTSGFAVYSGSGGLFTTPSNCHFIKFGFDTNYYGTTYKNDISINYPSTDHDHHAYNGETYTTTLGRTVYGGTLDVVSGELVVDRAIYQPTSVRSIEQHSSGVWFCIVTNVLQANVNGSLLSDMFVAGNLLDGAGTCYLTGGGSYLVAILPQEITTKAEADVWFASNQPTFVYELATPQTIQLTPQEVYALLGQNNVWADSGEVSVTYKADVTKWVEKKLS